MRCGSISSNYSDQCENREIGSGPSGMGNDTKSMVEISHKPATNFGSKIGGVEQAKKTISDAVLGRIEMVGLGEEGNQFQGISIDSPREFSDDEVVSDTQNSLQMRSSDLLQRGDSGDTELHDNVEAKLGGIQRSVTKDRMKYDCNVNNGV